MKGQGDPESMATAFFVTVGVIVVLVSVILVQAFFFSYREDLNARRVVDVEIRERAVVTEQQQELLESYGWVDRDRGRVRIPIDRAMDLVVQQASER